MNYNLKYWSVAAIVLMSAITFAMIFIYQEKAEEMIIFVILTLVIMVPMILGGLYMMFTGKGSWAISGYSTSPKSIQDLYNAEELSRAIGVILALFSGLMMVGMMSVIMPNGFILFISIMIGDVVLLIYALIRINKDKRYLKDPNGPLPEMTKEEKKDMKILLIIVLSISLTITGIILGVVLLTGDVDVDLREDSFRVDAPSTKKTVEYSEIDFDPFGEPLVELRYGFDIGYKESGYNSPKINSGKYHNSEFGDYILATYAKVNVYIIVVYDEGHSIVFNAKTAESTEDLYKELTNILKNQGITALSFQGSNNALQTSYV
jgi:hypothetical protein